MVEKLKKLRIGKKKQNTSFINQSEDSILIKGVIIYIITPYIRILDFDWLIAGVIFVYFHI
jgi:hypothetical protein